MLDYFQKNLSKRYAAAIQALQEQHAKHPELVVLLLTERDSILWDLLGDGVRYKGKEVGFHVFTGLEYLEWISQFIWYYLEKHGHDMGIAYCLYDMHRGYKRAVKKSISKRMVNPFLTPWRTQFPEGWTDPVTPEKVVSLIQELRKKRAEFIEDMLLDFEEIAEIENPEEEKREEDIEEHGQRIKLAKALGFVPEAWYYQLPFSDFFLEQMGIWKADQTKELEAP